MSFVRGSHRKSKATLLILPRTPSFDSWRCATSLCSGFLLVSEPTPWHQGRPARPKIPFLICVTQQATSVPTNRLQCPSVPAISVAQELFQGQQLLLGPPPPQQNKPAPVNFFPPPPPPELLPRFPFVGLTFRFVRGQRRPGADQPNGRGPLAQR